MPYQKKYTNKKGKGFFKTTSTRLSRRQRAELEK